MIGSLELLINETGKPGRVKRKASPGSGGLGGGKGRDVKRRVGSVAAGSKEVMVKISGYGKGGAHALAHLTYISRRGEVALENDKGQIFEGKDDVAEVYKDWKTDIDANTRFGKNPNQRNTMHMILSMPGQSDPMQLRSAVRAFAADAFSNHEYVFALHTDTDNYHCHLSVKCRGLDGKQLRCPQGQVQLWREGFAERLRENGIDAEATARSVRGVVRRPEKQAVIHIDDPQPINRAPRQSYVRAAREEIAAAVVNAELAGNGHATQPGWGEVVRGKQEEVKSRWLAAVSEIESTPTKITTKEGRELFNDRPQYPGIPDANVRAVRARAASFVGIERGSPPLPGGLPADLHKPGAGGVGASAAAASHAGVRGLPVGDVAYHAGRTKVLLRQDAQHHVGAGDASRDAMRRPGAGATRFGKEGGGRLTEAERNRLLAAQMRQFVEKMPTPKTLHEELKERLSAEVVARRKTVERQPVLTGGQRMQIEPVPPAPATEETQRSQTGATEQKRDTGRER